MTPRCHAIAGLALLALAGCDDAPPPPTPGLGPSSASTPTPSTPSASAAPAPPSSAASAAPRPGPSPLAAKPFLDQTQEVPAGREWTREVTSRAGGPMTFRVESQGSFTVTIITDKGMQAVRGGSGPAQEDLLMTADSRGNTHEGKITLPAGSSWFIIENHAGRPATLRLVCSDAR